MSEQKQNSTKEAAEGAGEFAMPDCCGPVIARMTKACGPPSTDHGDTKAEPGGKGAPNCCESMMNKMTGGENATATCPMSAMFKKTSEKRGFGLLAMIPGLLLVLGGAAIILEPQILVWLMAGASIMVGIALFATAYFFRKIVAGFDTSTG